MIAKTMRGAGLISSSTAHADPARAFADAHGLGPVERRYSLDGELELDGGMHAPAELWLGARGAWIVAALDAERGVALDLATAGAPSFERTRSGGTLRVGDAVLGVARSKVEGVLGALGVGRLRARASAAAPSFHRARHIEASSELEHAFLSAELGAGEVLLAWLPTVSKLPVRSEIMTGTESEARFMLTTRRAALVALSPVGDARVEGLDPSLLRIERRRGRTTVRCGAHRWEVSKKSAPLYAELERFALWDEGARLQEVARLNFVERDSDPASLGFARKLLDLAAHRGDVRAKILRWLVAAELEQGPAEGMDLDALLSELGARNVSSLAVAELWRAWQLTPLAGRVLLAELRKRGGRAEPWALALHKELHGEGRERRAPGEAARADITLAEHLIDIGNRLEAIHLLEARLTALPSEELEDLLPREDADLTAGAGGQALRIRVLELLGTARGEAGKRDLRALTELARLQPLVISRVEALVQVASEGQRQRAASVLGVLQPHGLGPQNDASFDDPATVEPLAPEILQTVIRHPLVREGSALLGRLQAMIAAVPAPDPSVIREYCERLSSDRAAAPDAVRSAARALAVASRVLGVPRVEAYVSRGEKGVGVRAYEADPPFVLIGGRHLETDSAFYLSPLELGFAIGAEVTHLRFGHTRATSSEVWAGALDKSRQGLDLALGVLPLLRNWRLADRAAQIAARIPVATVRRALDRATLANRRVQERMKATSTEPISAVNEQLVAAHRLMQLTADRAGLLIAGDLRAALRAILLVRNDYEKQLSTIEERGLDQVLAERTASGRMRYQDLAVRVAALLSFYLSPDYPRWKIGKQG